MIWRGLPLLFAFAAWFGLLRGLPETRPFFWFPFCCVVAALCLFLYLRSKSDEVVAVAFLFSLLLVPAGIVQTFHLLRLWPLYYPVIIAMTYFFSLPVVLVSLLLFSLQIVASLLNVTDGLQSFLGITNPVEAGLTSAFLMLTAGVSSVLIKRLRSEKEEAETSLKNIRESARSIARETDLESLTSEETTSHYYASMLKTNEELRELLVAIRHSVFADAASLFVPEREEFSLRCSTEDPTGIGITGGGVIGKCLRDRRTLSLSGTDEKKISPGYVKDIKVLSIIAVPILEGASLVGALSVDSARQHAFNEPEKESVERFAGQLARILERERIYFMIKRDVSGLKVLRDQSANLVASLNIEVIGRNLRKGAEKIEVAQVFFFVRAGKKYNLVHHNAPYEVSDRKVSFEASVINLALENRHLLYVSDMKDFKGMPFKTQGEVRSMLAVPMLYERDLLGLLVMLSEEIDFLDLHQRNLIEVLCNQASASLANARLHAKIEKLATTDGLTGLLNHRVFQEKFTEELKRQNRLSGPVSLILTDIDFFKKVNDTYGHPVGDIVLKGVSKIIRETVRDIDIPARYGGEEFAVILPETDGAGAQIIAERLRNAVGGKTFNADGKAFNVTISMGISVAPEDAKRKEELIEKADQALYHAKHNGRNQSVLWSSIR